MVMVGDGFDVAMIDSEVKLVVGELKYKLTRIFLLQVGIMELTGLSSVALI